MPNWNWVGPMNWSRCGGATYAMTLAYRQGAFAARDGRDEGANPYPATLEGSRAWLRGHTNECMGEHIRFGVDVIATSPRRSEEHTSELQSLMRISYAVFCLKKTIKIRSPTMTK